MARTVPRTFGIASPDPSFEGRPWWGIKSRNRWQLGSVPALDPGRAGGKPSPLARHQKPGGIRRGRPRRRRLRARSRGVLRNLRLRSSAGPPRHRAESRRRFGRALDAARNGDVPNRWRSPRTASSGRPVKGLNTSRSSSPTSALCWVRSTSAVARASSEETVQEVGEHVVLEGPLSDQEAVAFPLVEDGTRLAAAWLYTDHVLGQLDRGERADSAAAMSKWWATDVALTTSTTQSSSTGAEAIRRNFPTSNVGGTSAAECSPMALPKSCTGWPPGAAGRRRTHRRAGRRRTRSSDPRAVAGHSRTHRTRSPSKS